MQERVAWWFVEDANVKSRQKIVSQGVAKFCKFKDCVQMIKLYKNVGNYYSLTIIHGKVTKIYVKVTRWLKMDVLIFYYDNGN